MPGSLVISARTAHKSKSTNALGIYLTASKLIALRMSVIHETSKCYLRLHRGCASLTIAGILTPYSQSSSSSILSDINTLSKENPPPRCRPRHPASFRLGQSQIWTRFGHSENSALVEITTESTRRGMYTLRHHTTASISKYRGGLELQGMLTLLKTFR